jgi:hypothetical protein
MHEQFSDDSADKEYTDENVVLNQVPQCGKEGIKEHSHIGAKCFDKFHFYFLFFQQE